MISILHRKLCQVVDDPKEGRNHFALWLRPLRVAASLTVTGRTGSRKLACFQAGQPFGSMTRGAPHRDGEIIAAPWAHRLAALAPRVANPATLGASENRYATDKTPVKHQ